MTPNRNETVPKYDAANLVYQAYKSQLVLSIASVAMIFLMLAIPRPIVYFVAIIPAVVALVYFAKSVKKMNYLNEKYALGYKKIEVAGMKAQK